MKNRHRNGYKMYPNTRMQEDILSIKKSSDLTRDMGQAPPPPAESSAPPTAPEKADPFYVLANAPPKRPTRAQLESLKWRFNRPRARGR
jgi:hypothetical protein